MKVWCIYKEKSIIPEYDRFGNRNYDVIKTYKFHSAYLSEELAMFVQDKLNRSSQYNKTWVVKEEETDN